MKNTEIDCNFNVQFRTGQSFGRRLATLENKLGISRHEVARRLALLSAYELTLDVYDLLAEAAESLGGLRGFEQACEYVHGAFHGASIVQPDPSGFGDAAKKRQFVKRVLCVLTGRIDMAQLVEDEEKRAVEEKRKLRVKVHRG